MDSNDFFSKNFYTHASEHEQTKTMHRDNAMKRAATREPNKLKLLSYLICKMMVMVFIKLKKEHNFKKPGYRGQPTNHLEC